MENTIENFQPTDPEASELPETILNVTHSNDYRWFLDNYLTYKNTFNEKHNIKITSGIVSEANKYETLFGSRINIPTDENAELVIPDIKNVRWSYAGSKTLGEQAVIASGLDYIIINGSFIAEIIFF